MCASRLCRRSSRLTRSNPATVSTNDRVREPRALLEPSTSSRISVGCWQSARRKGRQLRWSSELTLLNWPSVGGAARHVAVDPRLHLDATAGSLRIAGVVPIAWMPKSWPRGRKHMGFIFQSYNCSRRDGAGERAHSLDVRGKKGFAAATARKRAARRVVSTIAQELPRPSLGR